ncbi:hypothetical protein BGX31_009607 [Mortierella sp. GBA43]|nr:hypothetical protein BGX31_009607 [Mortierella sp. GBA43]
MQSSLGVPSPQHQHQQHPQQQTPTLYSNQQASQTPTMGQQNLEQIREETMIESYMAGMESGEYFSQLQLQSPQISQAPFSIQSSQQQQQQTSGQLPTSMMTPSPMNGHFDYSAAASALAVSTPMLVSQGQTVFDMSGTGAGVTTTMGATPTIPSSTLLPSSMDVSTSYGGYPTFSSTTNPLFSSPPAISSSGTFSPTNSNMQGYFASQQQQQPSQQPQQYMTSGAIISPGAALKSSPQANEASITQDGSDNMYMPANPGMGVWDMYQMSNPNSLIQQQQQEQLQLSGDLSHVQQAYQQQQHEQLQSPPLNSVGGINGVPYTVTTPPMTPQRHPRLFHSQSQPGLRNLQQEQLLQQQQQYQQTLRRRQHSVHFTSDLLVGDQNTARPRHVSLPAGSYSAPVRSLASLTKMMQESPLGSAALGGPMDGAMTLADSTSLSVSMPNHGFTFLENPPPPMHTPHYLPTSPPLSSTDLSTPTTPKTRSRAGSKSRSRPTSTSSAVGS